MECVNDTEQALDRWQDIYQRLDREYACDHAETRITRVVYANQSTHYCPQCVRCGEAMRNVPRTSLTAIQLRDLPDFDKGLRDAWKGRKDAAHAALWAEWMAKRPARQKEYREVYLRSPQWAKRRDLVLHRDNFLCQGCRAARACDVHHLTYAHRGNEFLFELVAVCRDCHERLHLEEAAEQGAATEDATDGH